MGCFTPLQAWPSKLLNPSGKRGIVFRRSDGYVDRELSIPCGQCIGCRLERSRQWAMRCLHEAELHDENCFLTLTFNDAHLPVNGNICIRDVQLFLKRFRKSCGSLRFFACGEYGDKGGRPHYHLIIFGYDFPDKVFYKFAGQHKLYVSKILTELWSDPKTKESYGYAVIGDVTFESAAYVARYVLKKRTGKDASDYYDVFDPFTGVFLFARTPEFVTMSRGGRGGKGGIGKGWFDSFREDVYGMKHDRVIMRGGLELKPPKYYDRLLEAVDPDLFCLVKGRRKNVSDEVIENNSTRRLEVRQEFEERKTKFFLKRRYESGQESI